MPLGPRELRVSAVVGDESVIFMRHDTFILHWRQASDSRFKTEKPLLLMLPADCWGFCLPETDLLQYSQRYYPLNQSTYCFICKMWKWSSEIISSLMIVVMINLSFEIIKGAADSFIWAVICAWNWDNYRVLKWLHQILFMVLSFQNSTPTFRNT